MKTIEALLIYLTGLFGVLGFILAWHLSEASPFTVVVTFGLAGAWGHKVVQKRSARNEEVAPS